MDKSLPARTVEELQRKLVLIFEGDRQSLDLLAAEYKNGVPEAIEDIRPFKNQIETLQSEKGVSFEEALNRVLHPSQN